MHESHEPDTTRAHDSPLETKIDPDQNQNHRLPSNEYHNEHADIEIDVPELNFKRTTDMIVQQHLHQHRGGNGGGSLGGVGIGGYCSGGVGGGGGGGGTRTTGPIIGGEMPTTSGTSVLGTTTHQDPSWDKLGGVAATTNTLSKPSSQHAATATATTTTTTTTTTMPLRPARVHKAPRQSRQMAQKSAMSEYTTQLMYLEALNKKHLKDNAQ